MRVHEPAQICGVSQCGGHHAEVGGQEQDVGVQRQRQVGQTGEHGQERPADQAAECDGGQRFQAVDRLCGDQSQCGEPGRGKQCEADPGGQPGGTEIAW